MEAQERTIIVSSSRAQRKYQIRSKATTLAEFKDECREAGIDYNGLTFVEAISNTEMRDDNSLLPREVVFKGKATNNLVFSLTTPRKNIGSGAMSRKEAYAKIKELGLQQDCIDQFGDNYTRVSTENLVKMIEAVEGNEGKQDEIHDKPTKKFAPVSCKTAAEDIAEEKHPIEYPSACSEANPLDMMIEHLKAALECATMLKGNTDNSLSDDDIDDILNNF